MCLSGEYGQRAGPGWEQPRPTESYVLRPPIYAPSGEPVLLNVYGAQESIPRNEFRQPI
jgi:hypothetical protein